MTINEYQSEANATAIYPDSSSLTYPALGLAGEAGEICNKVKKIIRDEGGTVSEEKRNALIDELGDVFWYLAAIAKDLKVTLDEVARRNIEKLSSRQKRGKIGGSGDNR
jgi:NTP pyrophosphatase (non-canonical NTP hydrolase)